MLQTTPSNRCAMFLSRTLPLIALLFFVANVAWSQVPTPYTTTDTYGSAVNFDNTSLWSCSCVPPDSASVTITNAHVVMNVDKVLSTVTIGGGGSITLGSSTVTILDQFLVNNSGGVYDDGGTSTLLLKSTVAVGGMVTIGGDNNATFNNIEVAPGSVVNFDVGGTGETDVYVSGVLKMGGGSVIVNPPHYTASSTLLYDATYGTVGAEWTAGAASGKGVPHNVSVGGSGSLSFADTTGNFTCTGDFTMLDASGSLDLSSMIGNLTVDGNFTTGSNGAVTVTMPSVEGKGTLTVGGNMTLNANTTWTGDEGNVVIGGNLANNISGTAFGLLKFDGAFDQDITGNKITVDSLVVANTQNATTDDTDVDFQADVDITPGGVFNPVDGTTRIDPGVTFTMNSDANGTARIATLADGGATSDVHGDITFERYIAAVADGPSWLSAGNYVVGATRGDWTTSFGADFHMVFDWDETHVLDVTDASNGVTAWSIISNTADALHSDGEGYYVYTFTNSNPTLTASGSYNTSQVDYFCTFSNGQGQGGGWHVLSNPFASPIDGPQFLSDNSTILSSYYMYDNASDTWKTSSTGAPTTIDIGQSFWVQVSSAGNAEFQLDQLTHGSNSFLREEDALEDAFVGVKVSQEDGRYGSAFIRFHENGTEDFDWELEATRMASGNPANPEIYTVIGEGHELLINSPGGLSEVNEIAFIVETGSSGTVLLGLDEEYTLPSGFCGFIEDTETGEKVGLGDGYMEVDLEPQSTYANRFVLTILPSPTFAVTSTHCEGGVVHFNGEGSEDWEISWSDASGELTGEGCVTSLEVGEYVFNATNPMNQCHTSTAIAVSEVCMGDFNTNGERDITDLLTLLVTIQPVENFEGNYPDTDCDCDGAMTTLDLLMFLTEFGAVCD